MNDKPKWNKGAPPSIGWWPASWNCALGTIRWWNGEFWSTAARPTDNAKLAAWCAKYIAEDQDEIEWSERWWI